MNSYFKFSYEIQILILSMVLHGMVVNIPINTAQSVNQLPRNFSQSQTIQLQLFRKLSYTKPYLYETIKPRVVLEAARYLSSTEL